ncbi:MAG: hypothetical protein AB7O80_11705 [Acetobacteraceae bacterium]
MTRLHWFRLVVAVAALLAPAAHLLEMPNKLMLDGPLWLAVQHHLYRGWGPLFGGPVEILALVLSLYALVRGQDDRRLTLRATACYAAMLAVFFLFNAPANAALNGWTAATLPVDWTWWRLRWEIGHALAFLAAAMAWYAVTRTCLTAVRRSIAVPGA